MLLLFVDFSSNFIKKINAKWEIFLVLFSLTFRLSAIVQKFVGMKKKDKKN